MGLFMPPVSRCCQGGFFFNSSLSSNVFSANLIDPWQQGHKPAWSAFFYEVDH
jgi:hypothetical protein